MPHSGLEIHCIEVLAHWIYLEAQIHVLKLDCRSLC
jgi:hypothetical protein